MDNYLCGFEILCMYTPSEITVSPTKGAMSIGAATAGVMLIFSMFNAQILGWLVFVGGIYFGMRTYRKVLGGIINYSDALNIGFKTAFFASLILAFFAYVTTTMDASLIATFLDTAEEQLKTSGFQPVLVENAMQQWREGLTPMMFGGMIIFMYSAIGGLVSIVFALLVRNAKRDEFVS